uniref:Uncharacterized protein n=1 Tax=Arundo donax TaxID=35708 RepID=A0A0A8YRX0_ARUDO
MLLPGHSNCGRQRPPTNVVSSLGLSSMTVAGPPSGFSATTCVTTAFVLFVINR